MIFCHRQDDVFWAQRPTSLLWQCIYNIYDHFVRHFNLPRFSSRQVLFETITALDQFFQSSGEPCGWRAVDDIMIETDRYTKILTNLDAPICNTRFFRDAAECQCERVTTDRNSPANSISKHSDGGDANCPTVFFPQVRQSTQYPPEKFSHPAG